MIDVTREVLLSTAASVALLHTALGVDHYLPFVVLGRARRWSLRKVALITTICGVGHVIGSILLGAIGIALGTALGTLEWVESVRGALAAWGLIAFGLTYIVWSLVRLKRGKHHRHAHVHSNEVVHTHDHQHHTEHIHAHAEGEAAKLTFWSLFVVFALGPCEPLIPLMMAPAIEQNWWLVFEVTAVFAGVTIGAMVALALIGAKGLRFARLAHVERYAHVFAGSAILGSGLAIRFLGI